MCSTGKGRTAFTEADGSCWREDRVVKTGRCYMMKGLHCMPGTSQLSYGQWRTLDVFEIKK